MLPNFAFVDIESKKASRDFPDQWGPDVLSFSEPHLPWTHANVFFMEFGVACVKDSNGTFFFDDALELFSYLISDSVDGIVSFNGEHFDFPLLLGSVEPPTYDEFGLISFSEGFQQSYALLESKSVDILKEIKRLLGHRISLEQITVSFGDQTGKVISGDEWWGLYNTPEGRVKAINYLLKDVEDVYRIWGIANQYGLLAYRDNLGTTRRFEIKLPTLQDLQARKK